MTVEGPVPEETTAFRLPNGKLVATKEEWYAAQLENQVTELAKTCAYHNRHLFKLGQATKFVNNVVTFLSWQIAATQAGSLDRLVAEYRAHAAEESSKSTEEVEKKTPGRKPRTQAQPSHESQEPAQEQAPPAQEAAPPPPAQEEAQVPPPPPAQPQAQVPPPPAEPQAQAQPAAGAGMIPPPPGFQTPPPPPPPA